MNANLEPWFDAFFTLEGSDGGHARHLHSIQSLALNALIQEAARQKDHPFSPVFDSDKSRENFLRSRFNDLENKQVILMTVYLKPHMEEKFDKERLKKVFYTEDVRLKLRTVVLAGAKGKAVCTFSKNEKATSPLYSFSFDPERTQVGLVYSDPSCFI